MCTKKNVITVFAALLAMIMASIVCYNIYLDSLKFFVHPYCVRMKSTTKMSRNTTPPWFSLLADYNATVRSGRNLYVWSVGSSVFRLGNRLFNYAAVFGIAWRNGRIPMWPVNRASPHYDITRYFNIRIPVDQNNRITRGKSTRSLRILAKGNGIYDRRFEQLPRRNVTIDSVFSSYKYFQHVEEELRTDLTFKEHILDEARRWLEEQTPEKWKDKEFARVVIHVRRTDHISRHRISDGSPVPTSDYFNRSMTYFTDCLDRVQFVILSDDPGWCKKHINSDDVVHSNSSRHFSIVDIVYSSGHTPIVDMAIASLCDHAIMTVGTYGWWAAWFANGITITQRNFPINGSTLSRRLYRSDHYKPQWIGL